VWTNEDQPVAVGHSVDPARWQAIFEVLMARVAGRFARVEPRRRARAFVLGLLPDLPRKNCWTIAEHAVCHDYACRASACPALGRSKLPMPLIQRVDGAAST
jgi:hypothetical protein